MASGNALSRLLQDDVVTNEIQLEKYTVWINSYLKKVNVQVRDLTEDLRDGQNLILLLEVISGERLPKPERGTQRVHHLSNINTALEFMKSKGIRLAGIRAEEIMAGNWKMTLGMIWTVIARFSIQDITVEELHGKEALLRWSKKKTKTYDQVDVQNFSSSFQDGLALCGLIHKHRPELIPEYETLSEDNAVDNLNKAFEIAEQHLDIPKMLDAEELVNQTKPDERAVMTYVSSYYHAFQKMHAMETAAKRITRALDVDRAFNQAKKNYDHLASDLLAWINQKKPEMSGRSVGGLQDMQKRWQVFCRYNFNDKSPKVDDKTKLENMFNTLQTKLRITKRPIYMPQDGKLVADIDKAWNELEHMEKDLQDFVLIQLPKLARLEYLEKALNHKCEVREAWNERQEKCLKGNETVGESLSNLLAARKRLDALELDVAQQNRVEQLAPIAEELQALGYNKMDEVKGRIQRIADGLVKLKDLATEQGKKLVESIEKAERLEPLVRKFNEKCAIHQAWSAGQGEYLKENDNVWSLPDLLEAREHHEAFAKDLAMYEDRVKEMADIGRELNACGYDVNARVVDVRGGWEKLRDRTAKRSKQLTDKIEKVERQEKVWLEYATKVSPFNQRMDGAKEDLADLFSVHTVKEIDDLKEAQETFKNNHRDVQKEYESIAAIHPGDLKNPYATTNVEDLKRKWDELQVVIGQRDQRLSDEATLQQNNETLRVQFAQMANQIDEWIKSQTQKISEIDNNNTEFSLENKLEQLRSVEEDIKKFTTRMEEVNSMNDKVQGSMILNNPHTTLNMETLQHSFKQLVTTISNNINNIQCQIMLRDNITDEQIKELRTSFDQFDDNKKNRLEYEEFKKCLVSVGHLNDVDFDDKEFQRIIELVDPSEEKFVTFQPFLDFMKGEMAKTDTADQLMESFRILAKEGPYITAEDLKKELSDEQAEYCMARMTPYKGPDGVEGALDYQSFSRDLYGVVEDETVDGEAVVEAE